MKRVLSGTAQFVLYLVVFLVGSLLPGAHLLLPMMSVSTGPGRIFVYDGLVLMVGVYVVILVISALRRNIRYTWPTATVALFLALVLGLLAKFGLKTV